MKISIVTGFFLPIPPVQGGATEKIWFRLAQEFAAQGHEIVFVSRQWPSFENRETSLGIHHIRLKGADHTRYLALNLIHDFIWGIRAAFALPPADIAVCNCVALPAWLGRVKRRAGKVVAVVARMPKGQGRVYGGVDLILSLSTAVTNNLRSENPKLASRIKAFPFPIDWQLHATVAAKRVDGPVITIGYIGRLHPEKGIGLLLAACARLATRKDLPAWKLKLVGPIAVPSGGGGQSWLSHTMDQQSDALGQLTELVGPEFDAGKLALHYSSIDVFVYPSLAEKGETFGVAVAEAMAAKCAPIVSSLPCFNELVKDGQTGLIFDHATDNAEVQLEICIATLLLKGRQRHEIAARAQAWARQFDYKAVAATVLSDFSAAAGS